MNKKRKAAIEIAKSLLWVPYTWGGKNPMVSLDCSGFIQAVLSQEIVGSIMKRGPAKNSNSQFKLFTEVDDPAPGCLAFYGKREKINHVMMCLDKEWAIGAAGGNSRILFIAQSIKHGAYVKILPLKYRKDLVAITDPFLTLNGGEFDGT